MRRAALVGLGICALASGAVAQNSLRSGPVLLGDVSGRNVPDVVLEAAEGSVLAGLVFPETGQGACALGLEQRLPDAAEKGDVLLADCAPLPEASAKAVRVPEGRVATGLRLCLDGDLERLEGVALSTLPTFCAADPSLYVERDTGRAFRVRTTDASGALLRPPWQYARSCDSSVIAQTVSDAREGCKRWQDVSSCPPGFAMTGVSLALSTPDDGRPAITALQARCRPLVTRY